MNDEQIAALIQRVAECGYVVELKSGNTSLRPTSRDAKCPAELLRELKDNRAAIIAYLKTTPTDTVHCSECRATVYVWDGDRDMAYLACRSSGSGNMMCPMWRPGLPPEWMGSARSYEEWKRRKRAATNEQDIPE